MAVSDTETEATDAVRRPRWRPVRLVALGCYKLLALVSISVVGFALAVGVLIAVLLVRGPMEMPGWVATSVERQINGGLKAGHVTLGEINVGIGADGMPQVHLVDVGLFDGSGAEVARLNTVGASFDPDRIFQGEIVPRALALSGAQITVRRRTDGQIDLSFGQRADPEGGANLAGVLDRIDRIFTDGPLAGVTQIGASDLTITLEDARVGRLWQVTEGRLLLEQDENAVLIRVNFDVFNGTEELATTAMTFRSDKHSPAATIEARIRNAASGDIALQSPVLAFLGVLDAPISGSLSASIGEDGKLGGFSGTLGIGAGKLTTATGAPIAIEAGTANFGYDPAARRIDFAKLQVDSDKASVGLAGQAFLEDLRPDGWPASLVGQFRLTDVTAKDPDWLPEPVVFRDGYADLKLTLNPFRLTLGALTLRDGLSTIRASGSARATNTGPELALDMSIDHIGAERLMALWPPRLIPKTREWVATNVLKGTIRNARFGLRKTGDAPERRLLGFDFDGATVRYMPTLPPAEEGSGHATLDGNRFTVVADKGTVTAPEGGPVDIAGTVYVVPNVEVRPDTPAEVNLHVRGPIHAALSLLDQPPFEVMRKAKRPVDIAGGLATVEGLISLRMKPKILPEDVDYALTGKLTGVRSDKLVEGRVLAADELDLTATPEWVEIAGPATLGRVPMEVRWTLPMGSGPTTASRAEGTMQLSQAFLDEFGIDLPPGSVKGEGIANVALDILPDGPPRFSLMSDLQGVAMKIESIVWTKSATAKGRLEVEGHLGDTPAIDKIELEGGGLTATGSISLKPDGSLDEARLTRVRLGGWLDAPVTLVGRGDAQPGVKVEGGTLDFRRANFGDAGGSGGGPVDASLDRLIIADGIVLTGFRGDFSTNGGFGGKFNARLNGGGRLDGTVVPQKNGSAVRVTSQNAGEILKAANVAQRVRGGAMELTLLPSGQTGIYNGALTAQRVRVRGTPALAGLLDAISVVGLLQQLNGDGIVFDRVESQFTLTPNAINFRKTSATGASLGISVEGLYELGTGRLDLRGVFSPVYLVNGIGSILTRKGEGLFGFNYRVTGTSEEPKVAVNPLSILTPGMFREIFRAPPPKIQ